MRIALAPTNLLHRKLRTIVSMLAVSFPIIAIFFQLGAYSALMRTATLIYDQLAFDLAIVSRDYSYFSKADAFPRARVYQALASEKVASARPLYIHYQFWKNPQTRDRRELLLLGVDPREPPFEQAAFRAQIPLLQHPDTVLFDQLSRAEYGLGRAGMRTELGDHSVEIVGTYSLGTGFAALGAGITSDQTLAKLTGSSVEQVQVGLIQLKPGTESALVAQDLQRRLPADVLVLTRPQLNSYEERYWTRTTSVGVVLGFGLPVATIVGIIILYQILFTDITHRLHEFATLQAMGYPPSYVSRVVLEQAFILCLGGFLPGLVFSWILYKMTVQATGLPFDMTVGKVLLVLTCTTVFGAAAGLLSVRKAKRADPADLFK